MNARTIPIVARAASRQRKREAPKGRRVDAGGAGRGAALLGGASRARDLLIEHLHRLQDRFGHLQRAPPGGAGAGDGPGADRGLRGRELLSPLRRRQGRRRGAAALTVRVCDGLSCEMAGAQDLLARLPRCWAPTCACIAAPCIGRCEQAPAVAVGQHPLAQGELRVGRGRGRGRHDRRMCPRASSTWRPTQAQGGYTLLATASPASARSRRSSRRWRTRACAAWAAPAFRPGASGASCAPRPAPRLMAVNIDEGEPGTFKDRVYLERDPHRFLEGMLIAAWAVGIAAHLHLPARRVPRLPRPARSRTGEAARRARPARGMPAIILRRGAGAYICGEESAMIESIEGKRGLPRLRPPYVAQVGLFGRPTLEHNFETLYWVREILEKGGAWFAAHGRHGRKGLRSFSVSGRVNEPGVKLAPAGITVRELIDEYCGGMLDGHALLRLPARRRVGRHPAGVDWPTCRWTSTRCSRTAASSARPR